MDFKEIVLERYQSISDEIAKKELEIKALREERLPLAEMLDKWGLVKKPKRNKAVE